MWQAFESEGEENSGIREKGSLRGSSPGRSSGGAGKGRRACNYIPGI